MVEITMSNLNFNAVLLFSTLIGAVSITAIPGFLFMLSLGSNGIANDLKNYNPFSKKSMALTSLFTFSISFMILIIPKSNGLDSSTLYKVITQTNLDSKIQLILLDIRTMKNEKIILKELLPANFTCVEFVQKDLREYLKVSDRCK